MLLVTFGFSGGGSDMGNVELVEYSPLRPCEFTVPSVEVSSSTDAGWWFVCFVSAKVRGGLSSCLAIVGKGM